MLAAQITGKSMTARSQVQQYDVLLLVPIGQGLALRASCALLRRFVALAVSGFDVTTEKLFEGGELRHLRGVLWKLAEKSCSSMANGELRHLRGILWKLVEMSCSSMAMRKSSLICFFALEVVNCGSA